MVVVSVVLLVLRAHWALPSHRPTLVARAGASVVQRSVVREGLAVVRRDIRWAVRGELPHHRRREVVAVRRLSMGLVQRVAWVALNGNNATSANYGTGGGGAGGKATPTTGGNGAPGVLSRSVD